MLRKILYSLGLSLYGFLAYLLFLYVTFPSDVARDRLVYEANKIGVRMQLVGFRPSPPSGLTLTGVDIYGFNDNAATRRKSKSARKTGDEGEPSGAPGDMPEPESSKESSSAAAGDETPLLTLDTLHLGSLASLVMPGATNGTIDFDAELYGGTATGSYGKDGELNKFKINMHGIDLARYPFKGESYDMQTAGFFGFNADLSLSKEKIRESAGTMGMTLENFIIKKGSKIKGMDIPVDLNFKVTGGNWEVKNGRAELDELKLESGPLTLTITGSIMLNANPARSRANLKVSLLFGEELKLAAAFLPDTAKGEEGAFHYVLSGPLDNMRTRPDRLAARRKASSRSVGGGEDESDRPERPSPPGIAAPPDMMGAGFRPPVIEDAERERLREERRARAEERRRRREELKQRRLDMGMNGDVPPEPGIPGAIMDGNEIEPRVNRARRLDAEPDEPGDEQPNDNQPAPWDEPQE